MVITGIVKLSDDNYAVSGYDSDGAFAVEVNREQLDRLVVLPSQSVAVSCSEWRRRALEAGNV